MGCLPSSSGGGRGDSRAVVWHGSLRAKGCSGLPSSEPAESSPCSREEFAEREPFGGLLAVGTSGALLSGECQGGDVGLGTVSSWEGAHSCQWYFGEKRCREVWVGLPVPGSKQPQAGRGLGQEGDMGRTDTDWPLVETGGWGGWGRTNLGGS